MLLSSSISFALLSALVVAQSNSVQQPTLKFDLDLSPADAQIRLGPEARAWTQVGTGDDSAYKTDSSWGQMTVNLGFIGHSITVHGKSDRFFSQAGTQYDWKTILYITGTGGQFPTDGKIVEKPLSAKDITSFQSNDTLEMDVSLVLGQSDWEIDGVTVGTGFVTDAKSKDVARKTEVKFVDGGKVNSALGTDGTWEVQGENAVCKNKSKFKTAVPKGVGFIEIDGSRGPDSKEFQLHIFSDDGQQIWETIATEFPVQTKSLFFFTPIDPLRKWTIEIDCIGPNLATGQNVWDKITYYYDKTEAPADEEKPAAAPSGSATADAAGGSASASPSQAGTASSAAAAADTTQSGGKSGAASHGPVAGLMALGALAASFFAL